MKLVLPEEEQANRSPKSRNPQRRQRHAFTKPSSVDSNYRCCCSLPVLRPGAAPAQRAQQSSRQCERISLKATNFIFIFPPLFATSMPVINTPGKNNIVGDSGNSSSSSTPAAAVVQVRSWSSYIYTHCQPELSATSQQDLQTFYQRSYDEIKWYLLFIDLIFVAVVYNTENMITKCGSDNFMVYVIAISLFSLVFIARHKLDLYASTFVRIDHGLLPLLQNDIAHRVIIVLYGFGILSMAINIDADPVANGESQDDADFGKCNFKLAYTGSYAIGFILCKLLTVLWHGLLLHVAKNYSTLKVFHTHYRATIASHMVYAVFGCVIMLPMITPQYYVGIYLFPFLAGLTFFEEIIRKVDIFAVKYFSCIGLCCSKFLVATGIVSPPTDGNTNVIASLPLLNFQVRVRDRVAKAHLATATSSGHAYGEVFRDFATLVERQGLVFVLVLGEAIIGVSFANNNHNRTNDSRLTEFSSYFLIACFAIQFFETLDATTPNLHSIRGGVYLNSFFYFLNILLSFNLLVAIAGLLQLYNRAVQSEGAILAPLDQSSWQMSFGLFLTQGLLVSIRFCHKLHLRRSIRKGLNVRQKLKILYQLNFRTHLSAYEIASIIGFFASSVCHLFVYPICRKDVCSAYGIITVHASIAAMFSASYLALHAFDESKKEREYIEFQERRREVIRNVVGSNWTTTGDDTEAQKNKLLLSIADINDRLQ